MYWLPLYTVTLPLTQSMHHNSAKDAQRWCNLGNGLGAHIVARLMPYYLTKCKAMLSAQSAGNQIGAVR